MSHRKEGVVNNKNSLILFEVRRKLVHIFVGSFLSVLIYKDFYFLPACIFLIGGGFFLTFLIKKEIKIPIFYNFVLSFERKKEIEKFPLKGALLFLMGCLLSYLIFGLYFASKEVAIVAILTLAIGDSIVAIYGTSFGKLKFPISEKKHIDATILGIILNTIIIYFIFKIEFAAVFLASFVSLFLEYIVPFEKIERGIVGYIFDDNILIPLISGFVFCYFISSFLRIF